MDQRSSGGEKKIKTIIKPENLRHDHINPDRKYTTGVLPISEISLDSSYLVRDLDQRHMERLKAEIQEEGLIEPITVNKEQSGEYTLIAGQHRIVACKELGFTDIDAKIYWELDETSKMMLGYMSNEVRKRPAAGNRYTALSKIFEQKKRDFIKQGRKISEEGIINDTYLSNSKMKINEIIKGIIVDRLRHDPDSLASSLDLIQNAQVPKKKIIAAIDTGIFPLLTAQNVFIALSILCRQKPISIEEEEEGKNFREQEYQNVKEFFNRIVEEFIQPWVDVEDIDSAINFCRRHPFDAFTKLVSEILITDGYPGISSKTAPFYHDQPIDWDRLFEKLKPLKGSHVWTYGPIIDQRNVNDVLHEIRYYTQNGEFPKQ